MIFKDFYDKCLIKEEEESDREKDFSSEGETETITITSETGSDSVESDFKLTNLTPVFEESELQENNIRIFINLKVHELALEIIKCEIQNKSHTEKSYTKKQEAKRIELLTLVYFFLFKMFSSKKS
jgi:hypothetical protein